MERQAQKYFQFQELSPFYHLSKVFQAFCAVASLVAVMMLLNQ